MRVKRRRRHNQSVAWITAPRPAIPHGENHLDKKNPWPEDTLPRPRCVACAAEGYYDRLTDVWEHTDFLADHEFQPHTIHKFVSGERRERKTA